jgi:hypothetical protein
MIRIASEFGFTPASRSRISTPEESDPGLFGFFNSPPRESKESDTPN